jgi:hypothetical protein
MGGFMDRLTRARTRGSNAGYVTFVNELLGGMVKKLKEGDDDGVRKYLDSVVRYMEKVPPRAAAVTAEHMELREACSQMLGLMDRRAQEGRGLSQTEVKRCFGAISKALTEWADATRTRLLS